MEEKPQEKALLLVGMNSIDASNGVIFDNIWNSDNYLTFLPSLPLVVIPDIIARYLIVEECFCPSIYLA